MKPKVLYQETREANNLQGLFTSPSKNYWSGEYRYGVGVKVTRYDYETDVVVLEIRTQNRTNKPGFDSIRILLNDYRDCAVIREGIQAFNTALGQFERPEEFDTDLAPD